MIKTAIAFLLGCVGILNLAELPATNWLWLAIVILCLSLIVRCWSLSFFILGAFWAAVNAHAVIVDQLPASRQGQDQIISGTIANIPQQQGNRIRFELLTVARADQTLPKRISLSWYYPPKQQPQAGERWRFKARLKTIHGLANPGGFDFEKWLFRQQIGATGYIKPSTKNRLLQPAATISINGWRQRIAQRLAQQQPASPYLGMIQGLTVGIRDKISRAQWQVLQNTGTTHLLAISGLHIGLAATLGFFLFRFLWSRSSRLLRLLPTSTIGAIGGISLALFYALLAGLAIPTQRALIMVTMTMLAILLKRRFYLGQLIAFSLFPVLLHDPFAVLSAGFWLSYLAVIVIVYITQNRIPASKGGWLSIHFVIAIGLSPLLLLFFNQISLIGPLANLLAVPWVSFIVVPSALLSVITMPISTSLSQGLSLFTAKCLALLWHWLEYLSALPLADWHAAAPPLSAIVFACIGLCLLFAPRGIPAKWLSILLFLPIIFSSPTHPAAGEVWFTLLDVGQGLSAVIETQHHVLVYDSGPAFKNHYDAGKSVVLPFLQQRGISAINVLMISHGDNDHIGGAHSIETHLKVDKIITSVPQRFKHAELCHSGQSWQWDQVHFAVLHPDKQQFKGSANNRSCVLKITSNNGAILMTGDIEAKAEKRLRQTYGHALHADILLAPHHGSRTSSTASFIDAVDPHYVLFPTGYRNRYHFPATDILQRYQQRNIQTLNTAQSGAIQFKITDHNKLSPIRWRQQSRRLWTADATE